MMLNLSESIPALLDIFMLQFGLLKPVVKKEPVVMVQGWVPTKTDKEPPFQVIKEHQMDMTYEEYVEFVKSLVEQMFEVTNILGM